MERNEPLISVIIPTYNRVEHLQTAIDSVLRQTYQNLEIIIVDDGSTDATEQVVKSINKPKIRYIKLFENSKGMLARNIGIEASTGAFIAFLDSDDEWLPTKLQKQLDYTFKYAKVLDNVLCFTDCIIQNGRQKKMNRNQILRNNQPIMDYILAEQNTVQTSMYLVAAPLAKKVQFNEHLTKHQDWDFCLRLEQNGAEFLHCPIAETIWKSDRKRMRISTNETTNAASIEWFDNNRASLSKQAQVGFQAEILLANWIWSKQFRQVFLTLAYFWHKPNYLLKKCLRSAMYFVQTKKYRED